MMHFRKTNQARTSAVTGRTLGSAETETGTGAQIHGSAKVAIQADKNAFISWSIDFRSHDVMLQL